MRPSLLLAALLLPLASSAGGPKVSLFSDSKEDTQPPHARRNLILRLGELRDASAPLGEVHVQGGTSTIITAKPWWGSVSARGTGVGGRGERPFEVLVGKSKVFITPTRPLDAGEHWPFLLRLSDGTAIPLQLVAAGHADGEVAVSLDDDNASELRVELASMTGKAEGLAERLRQALQEQESEDFALAGLLAGGYLKLTALEIVRERPLVSDGRGRINLMTCAARHGPSKMAVVLTVTNTTAMPMTVEARGLYDRDTLAQITFAARAAPEIAPGTVGRLALVLDGADLAGDESLMLDLQVRRGDERSVLPVELSAQDLGANWWPF